MTNKLITPEIKDTILYYLCNNSKLEQIYQLDCKVTLNELNIDFETLRVVLSSFKRIGLIEYLHFEDESSIGLILLMESNDFLLRGGFVFKDGIFLANADKLLLEIDNLKKKLEPDQLGSIEKISNIANTLVGALSAYRTFITP